jgi:hypothetical protein
MGNKTSLVLSVLEMAIIQAKHVYFLDACMDHTFGKSIVDYFADQKGCTPYWIRNAYVRPTNRRLFVNAVPVESANAVTKSSQLRKSILKIGELLAEGKNVVVCSSSKTFTIRLKNHVIQTRPETRMIVYNSDTNEKLDNVAEYWKTCQLLVYSPTITAGVSFEESHFDSLVAFVSNSQSSPTVDITLQQLFRVRNLRDGDMHLFIHQMSCDHEVDDIQYPVSREEIVEFLQKDIGLASKYFSVHKVNVQSVYRPSKDHVLEYDVERLSFLVIVGILMMRNRSTVHFSTLLTDTLHFDYAIPCQVMNESLPLLDQTQLDMLRAAPCKLPAVPFEDVRGAMALINDAGVMKSMDKRVAQATRRLMEYKTARWHLPVSIEDDSLRTFYEKTATSDAQELFHRAQRFVALCDKTLDENRDDFARSIHHTLDSADPNVLLFKRRMHAYHMKIVLGRQYLEALLTAEAVRDIERHDQVEVHETVCEKTYAAMLSPMSEDDVNQFNALFEIKQPTGLMLAKWILGGAFGIDVRRRDKKPGRTNFDQILLRETYLHDMESDFNANIRNRVACLFQNKA